MRKLLIIMFIVSLLVLSGCKKEVDITPDKIIEEPIVEDKNVTEPIIEDVVKGPVLTIKNDPIYDVFNVEIKSDDEIYIRTNSHDYDFRLYDAYENEVLIGEQYGCFIQFCTENQEAVVDCREKIESECIKINGKNSKFDKRRYVIENFNCNEESGKRIKKLALEPSKYSIKYPYYTDSECKNIKMLEEKFAFN